MIINNYQVKLEKTFTDMPNFTMEEILQEYKVLGCTYTLEELQDLLQKNYNELAVADLIFSTFTIDDTNSKYAKEFIDLGLVRIIELEPIYKFQHYGIFIQNIESIMNAERTEKEKVNAYEEQFAKFFKMAKHFNLDNFDSMMYMINDGLDLQAIMIAYLDDVMELGRMDSPTYYHKIIAFVERFRKEFNKVNEYFDLALSYEYAQTLIALGNKKGEKIFLDLLEKHNDKTDVILHYALSYIDADEKKAMRIVNKYNHLLNKESDAYEIIMEMKEDVEKGRTQEA